MISQARRVGKSTTDAHCAQPAFQCSEAPERVANDSLDRSTVTTGTDTGEIAYDFGGWL